MKYVQIQNSQSHMVSDVHFLIVADGHVVSGDRCLMASGILMDSGGRFPVA